MTDPTPSRPGEGSAPSPGGETSLRELLNQPLPDYLLEALGEEEPIEFFLDEPKPEPPLRETPEPAESPGPPPPGAERANTRKKTPEAPPPKAKKKRKGMNPWLRFLIKLILVGSIFAGVFIYVLGVHIHHGNRMHPAIRDGDLLITYKLDRYRVGDAVVYRRPDTGETDVSRIVAIGSHEIQITEIGELLINGIIPSEEVFYATKELEGSTIQFPYSTGNEGLFLLDDYRTIGQDSRVYGEITEEELLGKVVYVFRRRGI